ncbi:MAG: META domain-containing protein [Gammaproteobacteria bacterium]
MILLLILLMVGCSKSTADGTEGKGIATLQDTYWKLVRLYNKPVKASGNQREIHLILEKDDLRARGYGGCNAFFGSYQVEEEIITFTGMGSTRRACPDKVMQQEQLLLQALEKSQRFQFRKKTLELWDNGTKVAQFKARKYPTKKAKKDKSE